MKKMNKLVRDRIPEIIQKDGAHSTHYIADDTEYWDKLKLKLQEEVDEFFKDETSAELVDVLEVIDAICKFKDFDKKEMKSLQTKKAKSRGKFDKRIIVSMIFEAEDV